MNDVYEVATVLFACLLIHIFFGSWFGLRRDSRLRLILLMMSYFVLHSALTLVALNPALQAGISFMLVLYISAAMYNTKLPSAIYSSLLYIVIAVLSEYASLVLLNILGFDTDALMAGGSTRAVMLALAKAVHFFAVLIAASVLRKNRASLSFRQVAPLLPCLAACVYLCVVFFTILPGGDEAPSVMLMIALVGLLYIIGVVVINTQAIKTAVLENEEQRLARSNYEMQERYYASVMTYREETRALWHDLQKHITAIEAIAESSGVQTALDEYSQIHAEFVGLGSIADTENLALNVILHHNISKAKSCGIDVGLTANVSPELSFSAVDLSVIIGNTFDNAIEECSALGEEKPRISVSLIQHNKMLFYEIANPCRSVTSEKAGKYHGYGLKNVRRCVEKYGGSMEHYAADDVYRVSIRLNCPADQAC